MTNRPSISLVVITYNEEELIGQCLKSADFCDEKIVVDSFSTDRTVEIALASGAKVFKKKFEGYVKQKQFALEQASCEWVLSLDADEQVTYALKREILEVLGQNPQVSGYLIRRVLYHLGGYFSRGRYPDWHLRLFRRDSAHIAGCEPHAKVIVSGPTARLKSPILHFSYKDIADHVDTINRLTSSAAGQGEVDAFEGFRMVLHPAWRFFNFYLLRGGFLDGWRGLYGAMAASFYVFVKYAKRYERWLRNRRL